MFYPRFLPNPTSELAPAAILRVEADIALMLVTSDRGWFPHLGRERILPELAFELRFRDTIRKDEDAGAEALLAANAEPLLRFIEKEVPGTEPSTRWEWLQPDWGKVRELLGEAAVASYRKEFAEEEAVDRQRREGAAVV
jgi:hypothetical protein